MTCPPTDSLLKLIKGDLNNNEVERVEEHLLHCVSCRSRIIEIEKSSVDQLDLEIQEAANNIHIKKYIATNSQKNQIEGYRIEKKIGAGAFGVVYSAVHLTTGEYRAIKVLHSSRHFDPSSLRRFEKEKSVISKFEHKNIVRSFPCDQENMIVMELLEGLNLHDLVEKNGPLPIEKAIGIVIQIAQGLGYAHQNGIVHRDVKPSNIFLTNDGVVKFLDLGLSKNMNAASGSATSANHITGTLDFLSPEQILSPSAVDHRSDIYSLGCVFYYILTGKPPFTGTTGEILAKHARDRAPDIRTARSDVSVGLSSVLRKMLEKEPSKRFQSMEEVAKAIENPKHHTHRHRLLSFLLFAFLFFIGVLYFKIILTKNDDPKIPIHDVAVAASPIEDKVDEEIGLSNPFEEPDAFMDEKEINLTPNGSFEEGNYSWRNDWESFQTLSYVKFDISADAHDGNVSATIEANDNGGCGVWRQFLPVEPNTQYRFSVWYKLNDVRSLDGKDSGMNLCIMTGNYTPPGTSGGYHWELFGEPLQTIHPPPFRGTTEWKKFEQTIETASTDSHIFIGLRLGVLDNGKWYAVAGKVFFDDVRLVKISP